MKKVKANTFYEEADLASIIAQYMSNMESPERLVFKAIQCTPNTVAVKIGKQMFLISVTDKAKTN